MKTLVIAEKPSVGMDIARVLGEKCKLILEARQLIDQGKNKDYIMTKLGRGSAYGSVIYNTANKMGSAKISNLVEAAKVFAELAFLQVSGRANDMDTLEKGLLLLGCMNFAYTVSRMEYKHYCA